jgi:hypothetical protein
MNPEELQKGQPVYWLMQHRGGWGYVSWVPSYVLKVNKSRVAIAAQAPLNAHDQSWMPRHVKPESLRPREQ